MCNLTSVLHDRRSLIPWALASTAVIPMLCVDHSVTLFSVCHTLSSFLLLYVFSPYVPPILFTFQACPPPQLFQCILHFHPGEIEVMWLEQFRCFSLRTYGVAGVGDCFSTFSSLCYSGFSFPRLLVCNVTALPCFCMATSFRFYIALNLASSVIYTLYVSVTFKFTLTVSLEHFYECVQGFSFFSLIFLGSEIALCSLFVQLWSYPFLRST